VRELVELVELGATVLVHFCVAGQGSLGELAGFGAGKLAACHHL
jgi:hypothetical protein